MDNNSSISISDGSKYLVSLDALDLSLLPNTYQPWLRKNSGILWSHKRLFPVENDYVEFEIKSKFGSDDNISQDTTHMICYICNTIVPKAYVVEHLNSSKHIAFQKIAETAIERVRKHKRLIGTENLKSSSEYFCEHCVSAIYLSNRNEHEKSKIHKNFAALDAFLSNFALLYTNDEIQDIIKSPITENSQDDSNIDISLIKVNAKYSEQVKVEQEIDFEVVPLKINENTENTYALLEKKPSALEMKLKHSVALMSDIESCLENTHKEVNNNVTNDDENEKADIINNLEQYIKHLKRYGPVKLYILDSFTQDRLRIETSNGSEVVVSTFNFHGFRKIGKHLQCRLCRTVVKNANDHRVFENHMKLVAQPLQNKHCIRRLDQPWSHCVICNEEIDSMDHTRFNNHLRKVEQALVTKIDSVGHTHSNNHLDKVEQALATEPIREVNIKESINADVTGNSTTIKNISNTNDMTTLPEPCKAENGKLNLTKIDNISNTDDMSCNGPEPSKAEDEKLNFIYSSTIKSISNTSCYCILCDIKMHVNDVENHLHGTRHVQNSKPMIYYLMNKGNNDLLTCKVCNTSVHYYAWAVEDHIAASDHVNNYNNCLATHKIDITKDGFFCNPCGKILPARSELSHIGNVSHQIKLASYNISCVDNNVNKIDVEHGLADINVNSENVSTEPINEKDINIEGKNPQEHLNMSSIQIVGSENQNTKDNKTLNMRKDSVKQKPMDELLTGVNNLLQQLLKYFNNPPKIHSHLELTELENVLSCKICTEKVSIEDTEKHTNSLKHIRNYRDLMTVNKLKLKNDNYVCYACNVYLKTGKELRHIETVEHEKRMESLQNEDYVLISADSKKLCDKIHRDLKVINPDNKVERKDLKFGDFITTDVLTNENVASVSHHFCKVIDNEKRLLCVLCQELVENTANETRIHANDTCHEEKYNSVMIQNQIFEIEDGFVCGFCECIEENAFEHIASEKHIANQIKDPKKNFCFICKESTIDLGVKEHVTSERHIKKLGAPAHFYCNVCDLQLKYNDADIQRHNEDFEHKNNSLLIDENKVVLKNKKCVCEACEVGFSRDTLQDHIGSLNHIMLLHHYYHRPL